MDYFGRNEDIAALDARLALLAGDERTPLALELGWYLRERDPERSRRLAEEAGARLEGGRAGAAALRARLKLLQADTQRLNGQTAAALQLAEQAQVGFEAIEDPVGAGDCLMVQRAIAGSVAADKYVQAFELYRRTGERVRTAAAALFAATDAVFVDLTGGAQAWADRVAEAIQVEHPAIVALHANYLACGLGLSGRSGEALREFVRAVEAYEASGQVSFAIVEATNVASVSLDMGDFETALHWAGKASEMAVARGWPRLIGIARMKMAECLRLLGRPHDALPLLVEATRLMGENNCVTQRPLGDACRELGRDEEALGWYAEGEQRAERQGYSGIMLRCMQGRAQMLSRLGRADEALALIDHALAHPLQTPVVRLEGLQVKAELLEHYGPSPPNGRTTMPGAIDCLEEALKLAEETESFTAQSELLSQLSRAHEAAGDVPRALACERRAAAVRQQVQSKKATNLAAAMQVRYETERAHADAAHHRALAEAESRRADAEALANRAKSTFLANMSHELRSPLNAMLGFTRLLLREEELGDHHQDLAIVMRSGEHLYGLINQVLEMSKIEAGRVQLAPNDFDLHALLKELSEMFYVAVTHKGLSLAVEWMPDVPRLVRTDEVKLRQVLINLLSNAAKFTATGGIRLEVALRPGGTDSVELDFEVSDTGPGIAPDELQKLGQAFVQARAGRQAAEGTGLGLAISRGFVQLMGGELKLSSELGSGTTARFSVVAQPVRGLAAPPPPPRQRVQRLSPESGKPRILAVDDRLDGRLLLVRTLTPLGFEVREAADGLQALQVWREWSPNLVLMDMRMPVMSGQEATRRIKAEDRHGTIVVALTASSFEEEREQILAAGCDDFLRKPFQEDTLLHTIARHLALRYVYQDNEPPPAPVEPDPERLARLPAALRDRIRSALEQLDVLAVDDALEELRRHDAVAADMLAPLAREFQYERLRGLFPAG